MQLSMGDQVGVIIQNAIVQSALGVGSGIGIEMIMPPFRADASAAQLTFEVAVQLALNAVVVAYVAGPVVAKDTTFGVAFATALQVSQPTLQSRLAAVSLAAKRSVNQELQRMSAPAAAAPQATRSM